MQQTERILREMIEEAKAAEATEASQDLLISGLFSSPEWPRPPKVQFPRPTKKASRRTDLVIAALGITLGLICALFPWYIFFNQEQFGVQAIKFGGRGNNAGRITVGPGNGIAALAARDLPSASLDMFPTGTLRDSADPAPAPGVDQQPFPAESTDYRLVHVANGRAMIEDDAGLWIVQRGSTLPDDSKVSAIEQRAGRWVMVTSNDRVIELGK